MIKIFLFKYMLIYFVVCRLIKVIECIDRTEVRFLKSLYALKLLKLKECQL